MKRGKTKPDSARQSAKVKNAPVPLIVPHGCAGAGRDFESAFDVLPRDAQVHELWTSKRRKARVTRAP